MPGRWKTDQVEVARGPMLAITDPEVRRVTVMGPTQLMKSSLLENTFGYFAHQDPSPILLAQPTVELAEAFGRERIDNMIRDCSCLSEIVREKKSRDGANTLSFKAFPGGHLALVGVNSPSKLASRPIKVALMDEVDKYPESAGDEGDVPSLIGERVATFFDHKLIQVCSPTIEGDSRIDNEYHKGDRRIYKVPCPHCRHAEEMQWKNVDWPEGDPESAQYQCGECKKPWTESQRIAAISKGFWFAQAPFKGHASFRCSKLVSPWETIAQLARKWVDAQGKPEQLKVFINTQLAQTWSQKGEAPDHQRLYERRELYKLNTLEPGIVFLVCGVDVQKDRIEYEVVGYGRDKQSWSVDYRVLMGDTSSEKNAVWNELDKVLNETWKTQDKRELQIRMLAVDSSAYTQTVYNWVRSKSADRVRAIKGFDNIQTIFGTPRQADVNRDGAKVRRGVKLWPVGVSVLKSELYGWLKADKPEDGKPYPPGYCHFPEYDMEHFKRLCSEQLMKRTVNGRAHYRWEILKDRRNEQLDCRVYARAAASMFGLDRFSENDFEILEGKFEVPGQKEAEQKVQATSERSDSTETDQNDFWSRQRNKKLF